MAFASGSPRGKHPSIYLQLQTHVHRQVFPLLLSAWKGQGEGKVRKMSRCPISTELRQPAHILTSLRCCLPLPRKCSLPRLHRRRSRLSSSCKKQKAGCRALKMRGGPKRRINIFDRSDSQLTSSEPPFQLASTTCTSARRPRQNWFCPTFRSSCVEGKTGCRV